MFANYWIDIKNIKEYFNGSTIIVKKKYIETAIKMENENKKKLDNNIEFLKKELHNKDVIDVEFLKKNLFNSSGADKNDIFISHSHRDINDLQLIIGFLKEEHHVNCFVDSWNWAYYEDFLEEIDKKYCRFPKSELYSYRKRNFTTSVLHISLMTSLMNMMDKIECSLFISTDNSNSLDENNNSYTNSPWIYVENQAVDFLKLNIPERWEKKFFLQESISQESQSATAMDQAPMEFKFKFKKEKGRKIEEFSLKEWLNNNQIKTSKESLDFLYEIAPGGIPKQYRYLKA